MSGEWYVVTALALRVIRAGRALKMSRAAAMSSDGGEALLLQPRSTTSKPSQAAWAILRVGWPIAISQTAMWVQGFVTIWLLGANGKKLAMAGYGLANVLCNITGHCILWGIGAGIDTLASQAWGAKEYQAIGLVNQRALLSDVYRFAGHCGVRIVRNEFAGAALHQPLERNIAAVL